MADPNTWRRCNACKEPIAYGSAYQVCSVSTCNRARTGMAFCSTDCWEVHLPSANHREAWAVEKHAPGSAADAAAAQERKPRRRLPPVSRTAEVAKSQASTQVAKAQASAQAPSASADDAILIVASRLKDYVRERAGFNTSDRVLGPLSEIVRRAMDEAIENARRDERKTVLDRDVPKRRS